MGWDYLHYSVCQTRFDLFLYGLNSVNVISTSTSLPEDLNTLNNTVSPGLYFSITTEIGFSDPTFSPPISSITSPTVRPTLSAGEPETTPGRSASPKISAPELIDKLFSAATSLVTSTYRIPIKGYTILPYFSMSFRSFFKILTGSANPTFSAPLATAVLIPTAFPSSEDRKQLLRKPYFETHPMHCRLQ